MRLPTVDRFRGGLLTARALGRTLIKNASGRRSDDLRSAVAIGLSARAQRRPRWEHVPPARRVLFYAPRAWPTHMALESSLALALERRGVAVRFATCGGVMPLCDSHLLEHLETRRELCTRCRGSSRVFLALFGFRADRLSRWAEPPSLGPPGGLDELLAFERDGAPLGAEVHPSLRRLLRVERVKPSAEALRVGGHLLEGAARLDQALSRYLDATQPGRVVVCNGNFHAERVMRRQAAARGIPVTGYEFAPVAGCGVFEPERISFSAPNLAAARELRPLTEAEGETLDAYLAKRVHDPMFWEQAELRRERVLGELRIDPSSPVTVVYPNVVWDSSFWGKDNRLGGVFGWLGHAVDWFAAHPERGTLVIRSHPSEVRLIQKSREPVHEWFRARYPDPPANVRVVLPDSSLSSYVLGDVAERVLVHVSTMGLEMAARGKQVLVSGEAHYRGLGFTQDVGDAEQFRQLLAEPARELDAAARERARRYAHLFFFRFCLPLRWLDLPRSGDVRFAFGSVRELDPGRDPVLDRICAGILGEAELVLP